MPEKMMFDLEIDDSLWSTTIYIMIAFTYIMVGITFTSKYLNVSGGNLNECEPTVVTFMWMFSWILGKQAEEKVKNCVFKDKYELAHYIQNPVVQKINDEKIRLEANMASVNTNMNRLQDAYNKSEGKVNNLAIAIENNVLAVKEGMQKIIAALVLQRHMSDGNLTVVKQTKNYDTLYKQALDAIK
jgi:hypothetical protein